MRLRMGLVFFALLKATSYILLELGRLVRSTYVECLGPLDQEVTTMDLLKRIELRMEFLTQHLERLPQEKVKIAQRVSCPLGALTPSARN